MIKSLLFFIVNGVIMLLVSGLFLTAAAVLFSKPGQRWLAALTMFVGILVSVLITYLLGSYICRRLGLLPPKEGKGD